MTSLYLWLILFIHSTPCELLLTVKNITGVIATWKEKYEKGRVKKDYCFEILFRFEPYFVNS